jgi:hypothetical protein
MITRKEYTANKVLNAVLTAEMIIFCQLVGSKKVSIDFVKNRADQMGLKSDLVKNSIFNKLTGGKNALGAEVVFYSNSFTEQSLGQLKGFFEELNKKGVVPLFIFFRGRFFYPSQIGELALHNSSAMVSTLFRFNFFICLRFLLVFKVMEKIKYGNVSTSKEGAA